MDRRHLLIAGGTSLATALGGCLSDGDGSDESTADESDTGPRSLRDGDDLFDPEPRSYSGSGEFTSDEFRLENGFTVATVDHRGDAYTVDLVEDGDHEILTNGVGDVEAAIGLPVEAGSYHLYVNTDGEWTVRIGQPDPDRADAVQPPLKIDGEGFDVYGPIELPESGSVDLEVDVRSADRLDDFDGDSFPFLGYLIEHDVDGSTAMEPTIRTESGARESATVSTEPGAMAWVVVEALGSWTVALE